MNDEDYMREALKEAEISLREGDWPIGCVIVVNNQIIARAHNQVYSRHDRMAHAEMIALRESKDVIRRSDKKAELYTTYEPCLMCLGAIILNRVGRVVSGTNVDGSGAVCIFDKLPEFYRKGETRAMEFRTGVLEEECRKVFMKSPLIEKLRKHVKI